MANNKKDGKKPNEREKEQVVSIIGPDEFMAETVFLGADYNLSFVTPDGELKDTILRPECDSDLVPPADPRKLVAKGVVLLPSFPEDYGSPEQLVAEILAFIHRYADVDPFWEELMAHYILMTWVYDKFTAVPYVRFLGEPESGKTRCLQVVGDLAYKAIHCSGATTAAPLFRLMEFYHGTLIIDEADYKSSDLWSEIIKILNNGYMKGLPILRCGEDYDPRSYDPFGPKILSTRKTFDDYALETRCITLRTQERRIRRDIPRQLPQCFCEEARELRGKLLKWRFDNYHRIQSDESSLLSLEPRLTQIGAPIYSVSCDAGFKSRLVAFLAQHADEQRAERPQAVIVEAIRIEMSSLEKIDLGVKDLAIRASVVASGWSIEGGFSPKRCGHLVRSLGFHPVRTREGYRFPVTKKELAELIFRYQKAEVGKRALRKMSFNPDHAKW